MKNKKVIVFATTFIIVMMILCSTVLAMHPGEVLIDSDLEGAEELESLGERILGVIQIVGFIASVVILMVLGIKYMTGSIEEKAGYKKAMLPYLIGATMLFSVTTISGIVYEFAGGLAINSSDEYIMLPFCRKGNVLTMKSTVYEVPDEHGLPVMELHQYYACDTAGCGCNQLMVELANAIKVPACPGCKKKLVRNDLRYRCESCGKFYKEK